LIVLFKAAVALLVLWGVGRQMLRTWSDLQHRELAIEPRPIFLLLSGLVYVAGLSCCAFFYENILSASTTPIASLPAYRAYLVSHLGKYVPGKAMVVVMRAGMSAEHGARGATAAIATFYETLVMMAAGGLMAALGFALGGPSPSMAVTLPALGRIAMPFYRLAGLFALGLGLAFLVVVLPPCFRRLALMVSLPLPGVGPEVLPRFSAGLLARGLRRGGESWLFLGLSQILVVRGLAPPGRFDFLGMVPVVVASVALATVAGFAVPVLPGGLGVREGVLMVALGPMFGQDLAVVAALALRLVWVAAELLAAAVLMGPWFGTRPGDPLEASSGPA
jgi:glycosyltransferase 2 family protein